MSPTKHHFAVAASELAQGEADAGLWAQSMAKALGNKDLAFATYLQLRAEELSKEELIHSAKGQIERTKGLIDRIFSIAGDVLVLSFGGMLLWGFLGEGVGLALGTDPKRLAEIIVDNWLTVGAVSAIIAVLYKAIRDRW